MELDFDKDGGLIPAIVQDDKNGEILMLGFMNREAYDLTRKTGFVTFFSRSRGRLWEKGESSGNVMRVREIQLDCDGDAVLLRVDPAGPACHTGERTCFYRTIGRGPGVPRPQ